MARHVPIRRLFESHLAVSDLERTVGFYRDLIGLPLAFEVGERNAAFFWVGEAGDSLLGLWSLGSAPLGLTLHVAFEVTVSDLLEAPKALEALGIAPLSFFGVRTTEPSVIGWMPAASVFFRDPDGHLLEYLAMLDEDPRPDLGIVSWSEWLAMGKLQRSLRWDARESKNPNRSYNRASHEKPHSANVSLNDSCGRT